MPKVNTARSHPFPAVLPPRKFRENYCRSQKIVLSYLMANLYEENENDQYEQAIVNEIIDYQEVSDTLKQKVRTNNVTKADHDLALHCAEECTHYEITRHFLDLASQIKSILPKTANSERASSERIQ